MGQQDKDILSIGVPSPKKGSSFWQIGIKLASTSIIFQYILWMSSVILNKVPKKLYGAKILQNLKCSIWFKHI